MPSNNAALKGHSLRALDALAALESREPAANVQTMELALPPRPVPRRKRAFILPNQMPPPPPPPPEQEVVLDGFVLLEACRCEDPDEAEKAVLEGCGISSVISEDLSFFRKLSHLDLGDNRVPLASLAYLPGLIELHLDCNGLTEVTIPAGGFPSLEVLNLSYNGLTSAAVAALADIPRLRQLDLSKNDLSALPADMSGFHALQSLNCEHNRLGSEASWLSLGSIPALRSLSLAHNKLDGLAPSAAETAFAQLGTLDLSNNSIAREEALLPVLQMSSLRTLLVYHNPFLHRGLASEDFHEVLAHQRGIELLTLPPPPPAPPAKIDLSLMTTVAEPPARRTIPKHKPAPKPKPPPPAKPPPQQPPQPPEALEEDSSSFFLTGVSGQSGQPPAEPGRPSDSPVLAAQADALDHDFWGPADDMLDEHIDIRTAVTALKAAIDRPPLEPSNARASHLKSTASIRARQRGKFDPHANFARGGGKLLNGMLPPARAGGAADGMAAGVASLQHQMGVGLASSGGAAGGARGSGDPEGDACVASLQSMLTGIQTMQVGASSSAQQPSHA